jgi:CheY-like chemotaxis protein
MPSVTSTTGFIPRTRSSRRILVVDDDIDSAGSFAMLVTIADHDVRTVHDGGGAIGVMTEFAAHVVRLDIGLPNLNGYQVARRIRELPGGMDVTLIALTGWGDDDDRRRSDEAGFDAHMVKPVDHVKLAELIDSFNKGS